MDAFKADIEKETLGNKYYRKVIFTGKKMQLVLMSLKPNEEIPKEVHHNIDQFIRVESGSARAYVGGREYKLNESDIIIVPSGTEHRIVNSSSKKDLKIYTIYADPEHPDGTVHKTKSEADATEYYH